jgi:hypothetical protein
MKYEPDGPPDAPPPCITCSAAGRWIRHIPNERGDGGEGRVLAWKAVCSKRSGHWATPGRRLTLEEQDGIELAALKKVLRELAQDPTLDGYQYEKAALYRLDLIDATISNPGRRHGTPANLRIEGLTTAGRTLAGLR